MECGRKRVSYKYYKEFVRVEVTYETTFRKLKVIHVYCTLYLPVIKIVLINNINELSVVTELIRCT